MLRLIRALNSSSSPIGSEYYADKLHTPGYPNRLQSWERADETKLRREHTSRRPIFIYFIIPKIISQILQALCFPVGLAHYTQYMKSLLLLPLALLTLASAFKNSLKPIELFSIEVSASQIANSEGRLNLTHHLKSSAEDIQKCQVVGSISSLDLTQDGNLHLHFTYHLDRQGAAVLVSIYVPSFEQVSPNLELTLDFMVAEFPIDYRIQIFNMTSYQEHLMMMLDDPRQVEMLMLLNGFNNISLSGNITHGYNKAGEMFTIHYMSCEGEEKQMGWINHKDYLLFTLVVLPAKDVVQKFVLFDEEFSVGNPPQKEYFYGLKGSTDAKISGQFLEDYNGVTFRTESLAQSESYGLCFLPFPSSKQMLDERIRQITYSSQIVTGVAVVLAVIVGSGMAIFFKRKQMKEEEEFLKQEVASTDISTMTKRRSTDSDSPTRNKNMPNYQISTVAEADEGLEGSIRGSAQASQSAAQIDMLLSQSRGEPAMPDVIERVE